MLLRRPHRSHSRATIGKRRPSRSWTSGVLKAPALPSRTKKSGREEHARTSDNDVSSLRVVVWGGSTRDKGGKERGATRWGIYESGSNRNAASLECPGRKAPALPPSSRTTASKRARGRESARESARARRRAKKKQHAFSASLPGGRIPTA